MVQGGEALGRQFGLKIGEILGKKLVLGACMPDEPDDFDERPFAPALAEAKLPAGVDLRRWMTPVEDQGAIGSCTANAVAGAVEYLIARQTGQRADVSRLFLYYNQRLMQKGVRQDGGSSVKNAVRVAHRLGVPHEKMWPYHPDLFAVQPPEEVYRAAGQHRMVGYHRVPLTQHALKACLAGGFPIAFGIRLPDDAYKQASSNGGMVPVDLVKSDDGGHAMLLVGYNDKEKRFIVRNSWGADWGDQGYGYIPYQHLLNAEIMNSAWMVRLGADLTFEEAEHAQVNLAQLPKAPPPSAAAAAPQPAPSPSLFGFLGSLFGGTQTPAHAAAEAASAAAPQLFTQLTGNALAGSLLGGIVQGAVPTLLADRLDPGHLVGPDRTQAIWEALHGRGLSEATADPNHRPAWDDGLDEEAATHTDLAPPAPGAKGPKKPFRGR